MSTGESDPAGTGSTPAMMREVGLNENRKRSLGLKLTIVARQIGQRFDQAVERMGVSRAKFSVIALTSRHPGATQRLIAEALEVSEVTAGRLIERLVEDGFLERRGNPADRRAHCVFLTPAAQPLLDKLSKVAALHEEDAFSGLDDEDLAKLGELLERIARNVAAARSRPQSQQPSAPPDEPA